MDPKENNSLILSKIRILRNFSGYPFVSRLSEEQKSELEDRLIEALKNRNENFIVCESKNYLEKQSIDLIDEPIKKGLINNTKYIYFPKNRVMILLNHEEHIRISIIGSGMDFSDLYQNIFEFELSISEKIPYLAQQKYGYMMQNLANCGLGMRLYSMIHIPGLSSSDKKDELFEDLKRKGYLVEYYSAQGENGSFYLVSSLLNYGVSEDKLIERFEQGLNYIFQLDDQLIADSYLNNKENIDDTVSRSMGILKYAKKITKEEALLHVSNLITGYKTGNQTVSIEKLKKLLRELINSDLNTKDLVEEQKARAEIICNMMNTEV